MSDTVGLQQVVEQLLAEFKLKVVGIDDRGHIQYALTELGMADGEKEIDTNDEAAALIGRMFVRDLEAIIGDEKSMAWLARFMRDEIKAGRFRLPRPKGRDPRQ